MTGHALDVSKINTVEELITKSKWLEGKTLAQVWEDIKKSDNDSRVTTKGYVGYVVEEGFFGIKKNSHAEPDIKHLGVEVKTCPIKFKEHRTMLTVKEPLSLGIINYEEEAKNNDITDSSLYKKNRKMLLVLYIHDDAKERSEYMIWRIFLWDMDNNVINDLRPDYNIILKKIKAGRAHQIHQEDNKILTLCPKHSSNVHDRKQPFSDQPAEIRAFRLKNRYMNSIICQNLHMVNEKKGGWKVNSSEHL